MKVGDACWYWDRARAAWVAAVITDIGEKNDEPAFGVKLVADDDERWGYADQIKPR